MAEDTKGDRFCVLIAAYQEERHIAGVVDQVRKYVDSVVVVDDGSTDATAAEAEKAGAVLLRHGENKGKGVALNTGFDYVRGKGYDAVITMDGDGQHSPSDVPRFIDDYRRSAAQVLVGNRMADVGSMPLIRRLTNRFMSWLLSRRMKQNVPDTQCGFRLFKCDSIPAVSAEAGGYEAESEILLRAAAAGLRIGSVPVQTIYRDEVSSINPVKDTVRFFRMLIGYRDTLAKDSGEERV